MATKTEDRLYEEFSKVSGASVKADDAVFAGSPAEAPSSPSQTVESAFNAASETLGEAASYHGTSGSSGSSSSSSNNSDGGVLSSLEGIGEDMAKSLGIIPLVGSLFGLFGGGSPAKPAFEKYDMPASIDFSGATVGNSLENSDYDQFGMPRPYDPAPASATPAAGIAASPSSSSAANPASGSSASSPQITVNVQAMDAKSFMDYSGQIAQAVRDAMLNMSSINDVVTGL